ncbi:LysR family transcriptional regulator [Aquabacterium sp.]|uniref:LysR family transcriptional regulator n=1 Tax=Aquabacterium sp. TaxID=1872578 RepID=UPI0025B81A27|nr:LysR family transcriptional regulator [Aquabacterium sp.]
MSRFEAMRAFTTVVDAGSFVRAAEVLRLSKAAVSRQVSELEAHLGVRLMQRSTRRLSLTEEGQLFYERSKELLAGLEQAEAELSSRQAEVAGTLRVNVPLSFGVQHLASLWGGFMALHPRLMLDVSLSDRVVDLVEEGFDMAVRITRMPDSVLVSRRLAGTRIVLCASPGYLRQHGEPRHPSDLARHHTLGYSYWATGDEWRLQGPEGEVSVRTRPMLRTNNGDTCLAAALADQGIILQPTFLVGEALRSGRLVELMPDYRAQEVGVYAVYPSRRHLAPKVRALVDFLADRFAAPPWPA